LGRGKYQVMKKGEDKTSEEEMKESGKGVGFVFKSMIDPFVGKVSFIRIFSGEFHAETEWQNLTKGNRSRVGHILVVNGKKYNAVNKATLGDIVAVTKMDGFDTNDTLSSEAGNVLVVPTRYPQPPIHMAVKAADKMKKTKSGPRFPRLSPAIQPFMWNAARKPMKPSSVRRVTCKSN
jgi:elongation factor G